MSKDFDAAKILSNKTTLEDGFGLFSERGPERASFLLRTSMNSFLSSSVNAYTDEEIIEAVSEVEEINKRRSEEYIKLIEIEKEYSRDSVQYSEQRELIEQSHCELMEQLKILRSDLCRSAQITMTLFGDSKNGISSRTVSMILLDLKQHDRGSSDQFYSLLRLLHVRELVSVYDEEIANVEDVDLKNSMIDRKNLSLFAFPEVEGWYLGIDFLDSKDLLSDKIDCDTRLMELTGTCGANYYGAMSRVKELVGSSFLNGYIDSVYSFDERNEYLNSLLFGSFLRITDDESAQDLIESARMSVAVTTNKSMNKISDIFNRRKSDRGE